jgi:hypothetical protein
LLALIARYARVIHVGCFHDDHIHEPIRYIGLFFWLRVRGCLCVSPLEPGNTKMSDGTRLFKPFFLVVVGGYQEFTA